MGWGQEGWGEGDRARGLGSGGARGWNLYFNEVFNKTD